MLQLIAERLSSIGLALHNLSFFNGGRQRLLRIEVHSPKFRPARALALVIAISFLVTSVYSSSPQEKEKEKKPDPKAEIQKEDGKVPSEKELEKSRRDKEKAAAEVKISQAEAVVEIAILAYGGREQLNKVRAAIQEEGTIRLATPDGDLTGNYRLRSARGEKSWKDLLRVDLDLTPPGTGAAEVINYVIGYNGASVWSAQNNQYVTPSPEAEAAFRAQLSHEYMALLRYKEDGSKIDYVGPETVKGLDTHVIDLTTPEGEKTRFWVSLKTYRVLFSEYEIKLAESAAPIKYRIAYVYTPLKIVQNTLVPVRRTMYQDGKMAQEIVLTNITYSAKLDPEIFQHLQG